MKEPKSVSFILAGLYAGGGERFVLEMARSLKDEGVSVTLVVFRQEGQLLNEVPEDVEVIELRGKRLFKNFFALRRYLKEHADHVVVSITEHIHILLGLASLGLKKRARIVFRFGIVYSEMFHRYTSIRDKIVPFLLRFVIRRADALVAVSKEVARDLVDLFSISQDKIEVIYNPKDIEYIKQQSQATIAHPWTKGSRPLIVASGRLHPQKDFQTLLGAMDLAVKECESLRLLILGDGKERGLLERLIREKGLEDHIELLGFVSNPFPYMKRADVFVLPSRWEGMPNVLLEALALGLCIVATDCPGGSWELLSDKDKQGELNNVEYATYGVLVPVGNEGKMAEALKEMVRNKSHAQEYRDKSSERVKLFAKNSAFGAYKKVLDI